MLLPTSGAHNSHFYSHAPRETRHQTLNFGGKEIAQTFYSIINYFTQVFLISPPFLVFIALFGPNLVLHASFAVT